VCAADEVEWAMTLNNLLIVIVVSLAHSLSKVDFGKFFDAFFMLQLDFCKAMRVHRTPEASNFIGFRLCGGEMQF